MALHVLVDSTSGISQELLDRYDNLHSVSLQVILGEEQFNERDLSLEKLFDFVTDTNIYPKTSQPSVGAFVKVLQPITEAGDDVVVITITEALSGTINGARAAQKTLKGAGEVHVIDSSTTSVAMVKMAETALKMAAAGFSTTDVVTRMRLMARLTTTMFVPETLEYLHKGGRIGKAATLFGTILNIKPLLYLVAGKVNVLAKIRTKHKAVMKLMDEVPKLTPMEYIAVVHIGAKDDAIAVAGRMKKECNCEDVEVAEIGAVLASHLGKGVLGIIYQEKIV